MSFSKKLTATAIGVAMTSASSFVMAQPANATEAFFQELAHQATCFGMIFSSPSQHLLDCGINDFGSGAGGTNYTGEVLCMSGYYYDSRSEECREIIIVE